MTTWPNWVDLVVIIIVFRTCYSGFGRGVVAELLHVSGAVCVTAFTVNYAHLLTTWLTPWIPWSDPTIFSFLMFWLLFLGLIFAVHQLIRVVLAFIKWEKLHWLIQGCGILLGGLRGLWWAGFLLLVFVSSGFAYLRASVEERSVLGPRLIVLARHSIERVTEQLPGAASRDPDLIPPLKKAAKVSK